MNYKYLDSHLYSVCVKLLAQVILGFSLYLIATANPSDSLAAVSCWPSNGGQMVTACNATAARPYCYYSGTANKTCSCNGSPNCTCTLEYTGCGQNSGQCPKTTKKCAKSYVPCDSNSDCGAHDTCSYTDVYWGGCCYATGTSTIGCGYRDPGPTDPPPPRDPEENPTSPPPGVPTNTPTPLPTAPPTSETQPNCSALSTAYYKYKGTSYPLNATIVNPSLAQRIDFYYVQQQGMYCSPSPGWVSLGTDYGVADGLGAINWTPSLSMLPGNYVQAGNVHNTAGNWWCTGNPSGSCGAANAPCMGCNYTSQILDSKSCSVDITNWSVVGNTLTLSASGRSTAINDPGDSPDDGLDTIRLHIRRADSGAISGFQYLSTLDGAWKAPAQSVYDSRYYYYLPEATCDSTNNTPCTINTQIRNLPTGNYTVHCDMSDFYTVNGVYNGCSGNPNCSFNSTAYANQNCSATNWVSCGTNDWEPFLMATPTPTPGILVNIHNASGVCDDAPISINSSGAAFDYTCPGPDSFPKTATQRGVNINQTNDVVIAYNFTPDAYDGSSNAPAASGNTRSFYWSDAWNTGVRTIDLTVATPTPTPVLEVKFFEKTDGTACSFDGRGVPNAGTYSPANPQGAIAQAIQASTVRAEQTVAAGQTSVNLLPPYSTNPFLVRLNLPVSNGADVFTCACPFNGDYFMCEIAGLGDSANRAQEFNINFLLTRYNLNFNSWWNVAGGNAYAAQSMTSEVAYSVCDGEPNCRSGMFITNPFENGNLLTNSPGFPLVGNTDSSAIRSNPDGNTSTIHEPGTRTNSMNANGKGVSLNGVKNYEYFSQKIGSTEIHNGSSLPATADNSTHIYTHTGNLDIGVTTWNLTGTNKKIIIFVDGNLNITPDASRANSAVITVEPGNFLAFIVRNDILIGQNVGYDLAAYDTAYNWSTTAPNLEGVFIANGRIIVDHDNDDTVSDRKFIGAGNFVGWGGVDLRRNFKDDQIGATNNAKNPAETFIARPDFVTAMPAELKEAAVVWREVAPE